ncbi:putative UDP-glucose 4-epimerase [Saccharata proteae CBS 121410]|uniref:Putative UDP-glucose 4-epimerase n=1 Tax=Saccharata proteae CBS 121410 TaxID=1314787 RepID=A0A6A5YAZ6_9PEZI|nr:putative UDP-glucose 4-epimerase [Saccharata proteae CBS 121410]
MDSLSEATTPALSASAVSSETSSEIGTPLPESAILSDLLEDQFSISDPLPPTILVVGGAGFIGSHTTLELLKAGYNCIVVDDLSNSFKDVVDRIRQLAEDHCQTHGKLMPELTFHELDYRSPAMTNVLASYAQIPSRGKDGLDFSTRYLSQQTSSQIAGVIHFAAFKSVEESIAKPLSYYQNNVCGLVEFLGTLDTFGIKNFVFSSSATVYGSMANRGMPLKEEHCAHENEEYVDETGETRQTEPGVYGLTCPYGRTKWMCEAILADLAQADPTWSITALRYFNPVGCNESGLLGEDPRQKPTNLIPVIANVLKGQQSQLSVFGTDWDTEDGTAIRDYIHVVDLARGHIAALAAASEGRTSRPFRTYNLGSGRGHTVREVVRCIEEVSGRVVPTRETARRPGDVGFCVAEVQRAETELRWKTEKSMEDCASDVWNFLKVRQLV